MYVYFVPYKNLTAVKMIRKWPTGIKKTGKTAKEFKSQLCFPKGWKSGI